MKTIYHKGLDERWHNYSLIDQMANIGSEIGRTINWKSKGKENLSTSAFYRGLELIDLTINDKKNKNSLKEILRVREALVDFFMGENIYKSTNKVWENYFHFFNIASRKNV
jgi:hypothetical protein